MTKNKWTYLNESYIDVNELPWGTPDVGANIKEQCPIVVGDVIARNIGQARSKCGDQLIVGPGLLNGYSRTIKDFLCQHLIVNFCFLLLFYLNIVYRCVSTVIWERKNNAFYQTPLVMTGSLSEIGSKNSTFNVYRVERCSASGECFLFGILHLWFKRTFSLLKRGNYSMILHVSHRTLLHRSVNRSLLGNATQQCLI